MRHALYSHCAGKKVVPLAIQREVTAVIAAVTVMPDQGRSRALRDAVIHGLLIKGWPRAILVAPGSDITVTSVKADVGLCVQTGNMARLYADLIKLQTMFLNRGITSAIIIVPSAPNAKRLGSNIAQAQRLERELVIFKRAYFVPTLIFGLE